MKIFKFRKITFKYGFPPVLNQKLGWSSEIGKRLNLTVFNGYKTHFFENFLLKNIFKFEFFIENSKISHFYD